jgi:hypothetical protein
MQEWIDFLNANAGGLMAVATVAYLVVTLLLLFEARATRNLRLEANVVAYPRPHGALNVELVLENGGPAYARDVRFAFGFVDAKRTVQGKPRSQFDALMGPGRFHRFLPSPTEGSRIPSLHELAERKLVLTLKWSWSDDRRWPWFLAKRHSRSRNYRMTDLKEGFYGGWYLIEPESADDLHAIRESLTGIKEVLEEREREMTARRLRAKLKAKAPSQAEGPPETPTLPDDDPGQLRPA